VTFFWSKWFKKPEEEEPEPLPSIPPDQAEAVMDGFKAKLAQAHTIGDDLHEAVERMKAARKERLATVRDSIADLGTTS
jgi:hypothetical protein